MSVKVKQIIKREIEVPDLGKRIKEAREASGRSLSSLAKEAQFSRNYWYQVEAEAVLGGISLETLRKIEKVLGVDFGVEIENE